jgi:hypothetical protein
MNVFALIACKRMTKIFVPRETLWTRTNRYHGNAAMIVGGSVEGIAKTAVPQAHRARWGRRRDAASTALSESQ